jgi:hypothetical protein
MTAATGALLLADDVSTLDRNHINYPPGQVPGTQLYNGASTGLVGDDIVLDTKRVGCL